MFSARYTSCSGNWLDLNVKEMLLITKQLNLLVVFHPLCLASKGCVDSQLDIQLHWQFIFRADWFGFVILIIT